MSGPTPSAVLSLLRSQLAYCPLIPTSSFEGQTVIITGANAGLGRETTKHIVRLGATLVILAVRTPAKGEAAREYIEKETGRKGCMQVWELDVSSFESVKRFAQRANTLERLDVLVCNAGIWPTKSEFFEGYESTMTVNVLSTYLLTRLIIPKMSHAPNARITILSSALHKFATLPSRGNLQAYKQTLEAKDYNNRYYDSKLLVHLYGSHLSQTLPSNLCLTFVNPGWCASGLKPGITFGEKAAERVLMRSTDEGARVVVDAVAGDKVQGRQSGYIDDCKVKRAAAWLETTEGKEVGERVWGEVNEILQPHLS